MVTKKQKKSWTRSRIFATLGEKNTKFPPYPPGLRFKIRLFRTARKASPILMRKRRRRSQGNCF